MHYELDTDAKIKTIDELLHDEYCIGATNLLAAIPDLARETKIRQALIIALRRNYHLFMRVACAEILDNIGDPKGTDHLIYNSLTYHPLAYRPWLKCKLTGSKEWGHNGVRIADKLNEKHVALMVKDMAEHQVFHGPTLAYATVETIVPAMLDLMNADLPVKRFASYVLAYHGNDAGAATLKDWALNTPYPAMPLEALSQLPGEEWITFLEDFADPNHSLYRHERYGLSAKLRILPSLRIRLTLKRLTSTEEKAAFLYAEYGRTLTEVEVYTDKKRHDRGIRKVDPPVTVLTHVNKAVPPAGLWAQDILTDLRDPALQAYLAEKQLTAVKQLMERAELRFENVLDARLSQLVGFMRGLNRVRNLHPTGFLKEDANVYSVPVKIYYEMDDYLNASIDWIINPLRHRNLEFGYVL